MSGFQIIGASIIFLHQFLLRDAPSALVLAFYLFFLILVFLGIVFPSKKIGPLIIAAKAVFCLFLVQYSFLPAFLLPFISLELPEKIGGNNHPFAFLPIFSAAGIGFVLLVPTEHILYFLGIWAFAVYAAYGNQFRRREAQHLQTRFDALKKELFQTETKHAQFEKAHANQEVLIKYQERESIAQKLHDSLGHTITGSIMQLEAADLLFDDEPKRAKEILVRVSKTLKDGLEAIRMNLKAIKPEPSLLGLHEIRGLLADFESRHNKKTDFYTEGNPDSLPPRLWQIIGDNLREALTNMLRHSNGNRFTCRISVLNALYKIEFRDDGTSIPAIRTGMGLEGMETRTREAGGTLIIDASAGFSLIMLFKKGDKSPCR